MGKSFNDDVFNNDFNLDTINGLNISKEAIEENNQETQQEDYKAKLKNMVGNINLDKVKEEIKEQKPVKEDIDPQEELRRLEQEQQRLNEKLEREKKQAQNKEDHKTNYVKKTMIFNQEYLDIINGLAELNGIEIKSVLNQLLEKAINTLDDRTKDRALKTGRKTKPVKQDKSIF